MALLGRNGEPFRFGRAVIWSLTWAIGVAGGVALGGWLTLVSGAGAPGAEALDPGMDLVVLPLVALSGFFLLHLAGQLIAGVARARRAGSETDQEDEHPQEGDE